MIKLLRYLRPYWGWVLLAPLAMALEVSMDLMQPALMSRIIDDGISAGDQRAIAAIGARMLVYAFLGLLGGNPDGEEKEHQDKGDNSFHFCSLYQAGQ